MSLLVFLIVGGIVGYLAAAIGGRNEGLFGSIVIGVVGSMIGGLLSTFFSGSHQAYLLFSWPGLIWALIGSVLLVILLNAFQHRSHHSHV